MDTISKDELLKERSWQKHWLPGLKMDIQLLESQNVRIHTSLLGYSLGDYFVCSFAKDSLPVKQNLFGMMVICRFLIEGEIGECYAFKSKITHLCLRPYRNLYLAFPSQVHRRPFREESRSQAHIPASITLSEEGSELLQKFIGYVIDISEGGCCFSFDQDNFVQKLTELPLHIYFTNPALSLCVSGIIRNFRNLDGHITLGVQFENDIPRAKVDTLIEQANNMT